MALTKRPSMTGLMSAIPNQDDPLGIGVQQRAREQDFENGYTGSMLAPQWTGMLQAWKDNGVSHVRQEPEAPMDVTGDSLGDVGALSGVNASGRALAASVPPSTNIASPLSLVGLRNARKR